MGVREFMAFNDLGDFIRALDKHGELRRISVEVDPYLEITEFADRAVKGGGPALLFERPKGSRVPLLINAFASMRRMEIALGVDSIEEVARRIAGFLEMQRPEGLLDKLKMLPKLGELNAMFPKTVSSGPCKEIIRRTDFSLGEFPILHCWPGDAGRFITLADGVFEESGDGQAKLRHVSFAGFRWPHDGNALAEAQARRGTLPAAGGSG